MSQDPGQIWKPARNVPPLRALVVIVAWVLPIAFVAMSPPFAEPLKPSAISKARIQTTNRAIHDFISTYRKPPGDLNVLRAFALASNKPFEGYDAFGQRLDFLRLDHRHYILRSFGSDGEQNASALQADIGVVRWGQRAKQDLSYTYPTAPPTGFYPAWFVAAAESPGGDWLARVYGDQDSGRRSLLVRSRTKPGLFMVARHDRVEEVLWLPDGQSIVFSATGSPRHRDGLFLWNLRDDSLVNLFDAAAKSVPISPANGTDKLWLSLAGVTSGKTPVIYAYAMQRHDGSLDPALFFSRAQLLAIALEESPRFLDLQAQIVLADYRSPVSEDYDPGNAATPKADAGLPTQLKWLALSTTGDLEQVLLKWHQFSEEEQTSPLFPYCLWILSALYGESYAQLAQTGRTDADVLRTFGTEIARVLIEHELAPTYLKSLGLHAYEALMEGEYLPYRLGQIKPSAAKSPRRAEVFPQDG